LARTIVRRARADDRGARSAEGSARGLI